MRDVLQFRAVGAIQRPDVWVYMGNNSYRINGTGGKKRMIDLKITHTLFPHTVVPGTLPTDYGTIAIFNTLWTNEFKNITDAEEFERKLKTYIADIFSTPHSPYTRELYLSGHHGVPTDIGTIPTQSVWMSAFQFMSMNTGILPNIHFEHPLSQDRVVEEINEDHGYIRFKGGVLRPILKKWNHAEPYVVSTLQECNAQTSCPLPYRLADRFSECPGDMVHGHDGTYICKKVENVVKHIGANKDDSDTIEDIIKVDNRNDPDGAYRNQLFGVAELEDVRIRQKLNSGEPITTKVLSAALKTHAYGGFLQWVGWERKSFKVTGENGEIYVTPSYVKGTRWVKNETKPNGGTEVTSEALSTCVKGKFATTSNSEIVIHPQDLKTYGVSVESRQYVTLPDSFAVVETRHSRPVTYVTPLTGKEITREATRQLYRVHTRPRNVKANETTMDAIFTMTDIEQDAVYKVKDEVNPLAWEHKIPRPSIDDVVLPNDGLAKVLQDVRKTRRGNVARIQPYDLFHNNVQITTQMYICDSEHVWYRCIVEDAYFIAVDIPPKTIPCFGVVHKGRTFVIPETVPYDTPPVLNSSTEEYDFWNARAYALSDSPYIQRMYAGKFMLYCLRSRQGSVSPSLVSCLESFHRYAAFEHARRVRDSAGIMTSVTFLEWAVTSFWAGMMVMTEGNAVYATLSIIQHTLNFILLDKHARDALEYMQIKTGVITPDDIDDRVRESLTTVVSTDSLSVRMHDATEAFDGVELSSLSSMADITDLQTQLKTALSDQASALEAFNAAGPEDLEGAMSRLRSASETADGLRETISSWMKPYQLVNEARDHALRLKQEALLEHGNTHPPHPEVLRADRAIADADEMITKLPSGEMRDAVDSGLLQSQVDMSQDVSQRIIDSETARLGQLGDDHELEEVIRDRISEEQSHLVDLVSEENIMSTAIELPSETVPLDVSLWGGISRFFEDAYINGVQTLENAVEDGTAVVTSVKEAVDQTGRTIVNRFFETGDKQGAIDRMMLEHPDWTEERAKEFVEGALASSLAMDAIDSAATAIAAGEMADATGLNGAIMLLGPSTIQRLVDEFPFFQDIISQIDVSSIVSSIFSFLSPTTLMNIVSVGFNLYRRTKNLIVMLRDQRFREKEAWLYTNFKLLMLNSSEVRKLRSWREMAENGFHEIVKNSDGEEFNLNWGLQREFLGEWMSLFTENGMVQAFTELQGYVKDSVQKRGINVNTISQPPM